MIFILVLSTPSAQWRSLKRNKMHGECMLKLVDYEIESRLKIVPDMFGPL